jgi:hypothetical protein
LRQNLAQASGRDPDLEAASRDAVGRIAPGSVGSAVRDLGAAYRKFEDDAYWARFAIRGSVHLVNVMVIGATTASGVAVPGVGAAVTGALLTYATEQGLDALLEKSEADYRERQRAVVASGLAIVRERSAQALEDALNARPEERAGRVRALLDELDDEDAVRSLSGEERAAFQNVRGRVVDEVLLRAALDPHANPAALAANVRQASLQFETMKEMLSAHEAQIGELQSTLESLKTNLDSLFAQGANTNRRLDAMGRMLYQQLSLEEREQALQTGLLGDVSAEEREELESSLRRERAYRDVIQGVTNVLSGAGLIAQYGERLGLPRELAQVAAEAQRVGGALMTAFINFPSNPIAGVGAVLSLAFGGVDAATQRHTQIMQSFQQVFQRLDEIAAKVDALSHQVANGFVTLASAIEVVRGDLIVNREILADLIAAMPDTAKHFLEMRSAADGLAYGFHNGRFDTPQGMAAHFYDYAYPFTQAFNALDVMVARDEPHSHFLLQTHMGQQAAVNAAADLNELAVSTRLLFLDLCTRHSVEPARGLPVLLMPPRKIGTELVDRLKQVGSGADNPSTQAVRILGNIDRAFALVPILDVGAWLIDTHFYHQLLDPEDARTLRFDLDHLDHGMLSYKGHNALEQLVPLLDAAIAQLALFHGTGSIDAILARWRARAVPGVAAATHEDKKMTAAIEHTLQFAPQLCRNLAVRIVCDALATAAQNAFCYEVLLNFKNATFLHEHLKTYGLELVYAEGTRDAAKPARIRVPLTPRDDRPSRPPFIEIPLPPGKDVVERWMAYEPAYIQLLELRRRVLGSLAEYRLVAGDTPASRLLRRSAVLVPRL